MNKRIEELAKECNILGEKEFAGKIVGFNYGKFAELIVRECANRVVDDDNAFDILKHFGVEE